MTKDLQQQVNKAIHSLDSSLAWDILADVAKSSDIKLDSSDELKLNYLRILGLSQERLLELLNKSILTAFQIEGYNLVNKLFDYMELLDEPEIVIDFMKKLAEVISSHGELLGNQSIIVKGGKVEPTIANWILDYDGFVQNLNRDALSEMKYINTSANTKILTVPQRNLLQSLLKIYDICRNYVEVWNEIPSKLPPDELKELNDYFNRKVAQIEKVSSSVIDNVSIELPPVSQQVGQPASQPVAVEAPVEQPATPPPFAIPLQKDLDLSAQPKRGLVFDQPTNINLKQEAKARAEAADQQQTIEAKLQALKQRKGK